jgi:hypothetical protein
MTDMEPPNYLPPAAPIDPPPAYSFPQSFRIGAGATTRPLVEPKHLERHLSLLRAFNTLRETIQGPEMDGRIPEWARQLNSEARWGWFVGLAVERCAYHTLILLGSQSKRDNEDLKSGVIGLIRNRLQPRRRTSRQSTW